MLLSPGSFAPRGTTSDTLLVVTTWGGEMLVAFMGWI